MGRPSMLNSKYSGLSPEEMQRQYDRDVMMWEQNEALQEQNRLRKQELEAQEERNREREYLELCRQKELEEQTKIQRERLFIENLNIADKEKYQEYKQKLDDANRTLYQIADLEYTYINNKQKLISSFQTSLGKAKNIGLGRFYIIFVIIILCARSIYDGKHIFRKYDIS